MSMPAPEYNKWQPKTTGNTSSTPEPAPEKGWKGLDLWKKVLAVVLGVAALGGIAFFAIPAISEQAETASENKKIANAADFIHADPTWTLKDEKKGSAEEPCDDPAGKCPVLVQQYTSPAPVTFEQLNSFVTGTQAVLGDCASTVTEGDVCESQGSVEDFNFTAKVSAPKEGTYTITVSMFKTGAATTTTTTN